MGDPDGSVNHLPGLDAASLRWRCDPGWLPFATTADVEPVHGIIGQSTAIDALEFGLATSAPGHHVFVRGLAGTGRVTLVRNLMERIRPHCPESRDRAYVRNFAQPDRPRLLSLPRGRGSEFVRRVDELAEFIGSGLRKALESDVLRTQRTTLERRARHESAAITDPFESELREAGLTLVSIDAGPVTHTRLAAMIKGEAITEEGFDGLVSEGTLDADEADRLREAIKRQAERLTEVTATVETAQAGFEESMRDLIKTQTRGLLEPIGSRIARSFPQPAVRVFLDGAITDVTDRRLAKISEGKDVSRLYRANLVVHHPPGDDCPIVVEITPSMPNLLGVIDHEIGPSGRSRTDHMMISAGALMRADGGFLLLEARDVLSEPGAWKVLVRTLRTGRLEIVPPEMAAPWGGRHLAPEAIDLNVKVVLIGDAATYALLDDADLDFPHLFKVLADFDTSIPRQEGSAQLYAGVLSRIVREEGLPQFTRDAVAALVEYGARVASRSGRLTARFGRIGDVAREAVFVVRSAARPDDGTSELVDVAHIREAIVRMRRRADLPARRFRELIADRTIEVCLDGAVVGQVNGLAVVHAGPLVYGFPQRITATVGPGAGGVINIEREAELSGAIHTKGFYILAGLLRRLLQLDHPLVFDASIAFEQSYGGIDGDSASAAEMVSLLSAITGWPVRQDLAITGAIDQRGSIMAIGAVNEKIEGFHDACADLGLTGRQGCLVPESNVGDLMLREDVVQACADGRFHVHPVGTIGAAISLLLGREAGVAVDGRYPEGTVLGEAQRRLTAYWSAAQAAVRGAAR